MPKFKVLYSSEKFAMGDMCEHTFESSIEQMNSVPYDTAAKAAAKKHNVHFNDIKIYKIMGA